MANKRPGVIDAFRPGWSIAQAGERRNISIYVLLFLILITEGSYRYTTSMESPVYTTIVYVKPIKNTYISGYSFEFFFYDKDKIKQRLIVYEISFNHNTLVSGDRFNFVYDAAKRSKEFNDYYVYKILFEEPVFLSEDVTESTIGVIKKLSYGVCEFTYQAIGNSHVTYEKCQAYDKSLEKKYPTLRVGGNFEVKYRVGNPKCSIIYFENPR